MILISVHDTLSYRKFINEFRQIHKRIKQSVRNKNIGQKKVNTFVSYNIIESVYCECIRISDTSGAASPESSIHNIDTKYTRIQDLFIFHFGLLGYHFSRKQADFL